MNTVYSSSDQTGHENPAFDGTSESNTADLPDPDYKETAKNDDDTLPKYSTNLDKLSDINIDTKRRNNRKNRKDRRRSSGDDRIQRKNSLAVDVNGCDTLTKYFLGVFVRLMLIAG